MSDMQYSDIVNALSLIDYKALMFACVTGIFVFKKARNLKKIELERTLSIDKKFEIKKTPEVDRLFSEINTAHLLRQELGEETLLFANKITDSIPNEHLTFFFNNLNTLSINPKLLSARIALLLSSGRSGYLNGYNQLLLDKKKQYNDIYHELLHASSSFVDKVCKILYSGFMQINLNTYKEIGRGIDEGYTQLLALRYFNVENNVYLMETTIAEHIECIVGIEKMEELYFKADLYGLAEELKPYAEYDAIMEFLTNVDYACAFRKKKKFTERDREYLGGLYRNILNFLFHCIFKALVSRFNGTVSTQDMEEKIQTIRDLCKGYAFDNDEDEFTKFIENAIEEAKVLWKTQDVVQNPQRI